MALKPKSFLPAKLPPSCDNAPHCKDVGAYGIYFHGGRNLCKSCHLGAFAKERHEAWVAKGQLTSAQSIDEIRRLRTLPKDPRAWIKNPRSDLARRFAEEVMHRKPIVEREPGQDDEELPLGIPRDPLEAEFEAQP